MRDGGGQKGSGLRNVSKWTSSRNIKEGGVMGFGDWLKSKRSKGQPPTFPLSVQMEVKCSLWELSQQSFWWYWESDWAGWPLKAIQSINCDQIPFPQDLSKLPQSKNKCCGKSSKLIFNQKKKKKVQDWYSSWLKNSDSPRKGVKENWPETLEPKDT